MGVALGTKLAAEQLADTITTSYVFISSCQFRSLDKIALWMNARDNSDCKPDLKYT